MFKKNFKNFDFFLKILLDLYGVYVVDYILNKAIETRALRLWPPDTQLKPKEQEKGADENSSEDEVLRKYWCCSCQLKPRKQAFTKVCAYGCNSFWKQEKDQNSEVCSFAKKKTR